MRDSVVLAKELKVDQNIKKYNATFGAIFKHKNISTTEKYFT